MEPYLSTIAGGYGNIIRSNADFSTVGGGHQNVIHPSLRLM